MSHSHRLLLASLLLCSTATQAAVTTLYPSFDAYITRFVSTTPFGGGSNSTSVTSSELQLESSYTRSPNFSGGSNTTSNYIRMHFDLTGINPALVVAASLTWTETVDTLVAPNRHDLQTAVGTSFTLPGANENPPLFPAILPQVANNAVDPTITLDILTLVSGLPNQSPNILLFQIVPQEPTAVFPAITTFFVRPYRIYSSEAGEALSPKIVLTTVVPEISSPMLMGIACVGIALAHRIRR